jgi:hypothetical protein
MTTETLRISLYDGECTGDMASLTQLCDIDGVVPDERRASNVFAEALHVLDLYARKHSVSRLSGSSFTVLIVRKDGAVETPLVRLDGYARNGYASASITGQGPRWDTERASYSVDDDVLIIVRKILMSLSSDNH